MKRLVPLVLVPLVIVLGVAVRAQQSAQQSLAAYQAAPGLQLKLWAAEPMLANPTNITVDERGRVWVVEGVNYRRSSASFPIPVPKAIASSSSKTPIRTARPTE